MLPRAKKRNGAKRILGGVTKHVKLNFGYNVAEVRARDDQMLKIGQISAPISERFTYRVRKWVVPLLTAYAPYIFQQKPGLDSKRCH